MTLYGIGSCEDVWSEMTLTITAAPQAYAGVDADICQTDTYLLAVATASNYDFVVWTTSGNGTFDDPNAVNPVYTPGSVDLAMGSVILTITAHGNGSCGDDAYDQMTLQIHALPEAEAGDGGVICFGEEFQITDASAENYDYLLWTSSGDGSFSDNSITEPIYYAGPMDVEAGYAELTLTAYGYGSCGSASDFIILSVNGAPAADAGIDQLIPPGTSTQLHGQATGGSGSYTYSWEPGDFIINSNAQNPTTFDLWASTTFVLTVTDKLTGCAGMDTVVVYTQDPHQPPVAVDDYDTTYVDIPVVIDILANDYDPDGGTLTAELCGGPYNGIAVINSDGTLTYTPYDGFTGDDFLCYYICDDGTPSLCDTATVYIHVLPLSDVDDNIIIYNGFTPNDDGVNDRWVIEGIELYPDNEVLVFNRWGDIVKRIYGYDNANNFWDGTRDDNLILPDGTYYYVIKIIYQGQDKYYTGWVFIHGVKK
jgi:gliding motility-associated-like protein